MPNKQVRIHAHGVFQFSLTVPQDKDLAEIASSCAETMKLTHLVPQIKPGLINFVAKR